MAGLGVDDLALDAGVDPRTVEAFVDAGILAPDEAGSFRPPDIARTRLVDSLVEAGLDLETLSSAVREGRLTLSFIDHLIPNPIRLVPAPTNETEARSIGYEEAIRPILGLERSADDPIREDDLALLGAVAEAIELGASLDRVVRIVRSIAQAAAKLTDLQRDFVDEVLLAPAIARTGSPILALEETAATRLRYRELGKEVTGMLMDRFVDDAVHKNLVELTEQALSAAGLHPVEHEQTIVFLDVSNYTRLSEQRGDAASASQATLLVDVVAKLARKHGGRLVKSLGDGAMVHLSHPRAGILLALDAVASAEPVGLWPLHAGVNSGPMVRRDGDFFGASVNVASRVSNIAGPGEVVVTEEVVSAVGDSDMRFIPLGEFNLKNVGEPVSLFRVEKQAE